jgi:hypothetical protein
MGGDTMQKYIMVKATEEYRNEVRKMAHKHEMNISQFIRYLIDKEKQDMRKEDEGNERCMYEM